MVSFLEARYQLARYSEVSMPKKKNNEVLPLDINEFKLVPHGQAPKRKAQVFMALQNTEMNPSLVNTTQGGVPEDFTARRVVVTTTSSHVRYAVAPYGIYDGGDEATYYKEV